MANKKGCQAYLAPYFVDAASDPKIALQAAVADRFGEVHLVDLFIVGDVGCSVSFYLTGVRGDCLGLFDRLT